VNVPPNATDRASKRTDPAAQRTIPRVVRAAAERYGSASAIEDGEVRLTFDELAAEGLRAARACIAAGIEPGDRVGIWAPNIAEWIISAIGVMNAGAIVVTLNTRHKGVEAAYTLRQSGAKLLFTIDEFVGTNYVAALEGHDLPELGQIVVLRGTADGAMTWQDFLAGAKRVSEDEARARADAVSPEDLSDFIFTSGTTGNPKAVMTAHGQNCETFETWSGVVGLREDDRYLVVGPFFHTFGYKAGWLACLMRGATILPQLVFDAGEVMERIQNEKITTLPGAPTIYQSILAHPDLAKVDLSSLRLAVTGAAPVPVELVHQMRDVLGFETVLTAYGLTECCGVVTMCHQGDAPEIISGTSGRAIPGVEVRLIDAKGKAVAPGEPGEILVRGYNVMRGYFDDEEQTAETIDPDGWLHTGDVGVMDEGGNVTITDRIKDMFIMGGFNVYPAEVENILYSSGKFQQVAVIGVPDERMGEVGMAFVIPAAGKTVTSEEVTAWSRENMANYKVPRFVEVVDALPTNATGKVLKFELRERARAGRPG